MELLVFVLPLAPVAMAIARWTRFHPLLIAATLALLPAALGGLAMAGAMAGGATALIVAAMGYAAGGFVAALGAFGGWLRRVHVQRIG